MCMILPEDHTHLFQSTVLMLEFRVSTSYNKDLNNLLFLVAGGLPQSTKLTIDPDLIVVLVLFGSFQLNKKYETCSGGKL